MEAPCKVFGDNTIRFASTFRLLTIMFLMPDPIKVLGEERTLGRWSYRSLNVSVAVFKESMQEGHFQGHDPIDLSLKIWGQVSRILAFTSNRNGNVHW